jgi:chromate transporter
MPRFRSTPAPPPGTSPQPVPQPQSLLRSLAWYFLRLGTFGFGGPIALTGYMQRDLVEVRGWITPAEYKEGLALAQLAPGPLAAQLAIYLGWVRGGVLGAAVIGTAFIAPSFLMVLLISAVYLRYGGLPWMQAAFYGVGAAVIAIIARSAGKLLRMTAGRDVLLWGVVGINALVTAVTESEVLWVFLLSGVVILVARWKFPGSLMSAIAPWGVGLVGLSGAASPDTLLQLLWFFTKSGMVVFGSGLAIVPFLHGGVVEQYRWLTERQFLDAIAVSMITPGPVVITVAFIGYLVAGPLGSLVAAVGLFVPVYVITIAMAPSFHRLARNRQVRFFVDGVTAAATGAIIGATVILGRRALVDPPTVVLFLTTLLTLTYVRRIPEPLIILAAGLIGLIVQPPP